MHILVLNAGSSSDKCILFQDTAAIWKCHIDYQEQKLEITCKGQTAIRPFSGKRPEILAEAIQDIWSVQQLTAKEAICCVGHRVVQGGGHFSEPVLITPEVKAAIKQLIPIAPLHNPVNLEGIEILEKLFPNIPQVAVFDTAFYHHLPKVEATYPIPAAWRQTGIKRYGFHGISHEYCVQQAAQHVAQPLSKLKLVSCHLGNGASITATSHGQPIATSMGFTPLEGVMMGTRSGSIDPGILLHLLKEGVDQQELDRALNKESGLKAIAGEPDMRRLAIRYAQNDPEAKLAVEMYAWRIKSYIGHMFFLLGGADILLFTAGVGEHSALVRSLCCNNLEAFGIQLDAVKNEKNAIEISSGSCRILVIPTQEELAIANYCHSLLKSSF